MCNFKNVYDVVTLLHNQKISLSEGLITLNELHFSLDKINLDLKQIEHKKIYFNNINIYKVEIYELSEMVIKIINLIKSYIIDIDLLYADLINISTNSKADEAWRYEGHLKRINNCLVADELLLSVEKLSKIVLEKVNKLPAVS